MNIKSTAIFDFLLKNFITSLLRNLISLSLLNSFLFLSRFSVSLKSLDNYFFRWFAYKPLFSRFSVLISYNMWSSHHFSLSSCFPCFSGSRFFRVRVQGPGFRSSYLFCLCRFALIFMTGRPILNASSFFGTSQYFISHIFR